MSRPGLTVGEATQSAVDFTRAAMSSLWGVQTLAALGVALAFVAVRGRITAAEAADLGRLGSWTILVTVAPLWAGLYRLELGGKALRGLGLAGFQFGMAELRMVALTLAFLGAALMIWLPVVAISALVFILFRFAGQVALGPLGVVQVSFLIAAGVWLAALGGFTWACGRCAFAAPASVGKRRLVLVDAWALGRGQAGLVVWTWLLAQAPLLLTLTLLALVNSLEAQDGMRGRWPLADAGVGGLVLGLVCAFIQAPMTVGVLGHLYRARRERARVFTAQDAVRYEPELLAG
jgi:hypothetical protein